MASPSLCSVLLMSNLAGIKTLSMLTHDLDQFYAASTTATPALAAWLRLQFHPVQVYALIQQIIKNPKLLAEVAARSYQHGNGFLKVVLIDRGYKLRLHVWFAGQSCEENIHDHRWSFASTILTGTLTSEIWQDVDAHRNSAELSTHEYVYHAATADQPAYKTDLGLCHLRREAVVQQSAGAAYVMPELRLHRIINNGDRLVATMMCTAPTGQGTTRLIPMHDGIDPNTQPPKVSPAQLKAALQRFYAQYTQEQRHSCAH